VLDDMMGIQLHHYPSSTGANTTVVANWGIYKAAQLLAQLQHIGRLRTSDPRGRKIPEANQGLVQRSDQYSGDTRGVCTTERASNCVNKGHYVLISKNQKNILAMFYV